MSSLENTLDIGKLSALLGTDKETIIDLVESNKRLILDYSEEDGLWNKNSAPIRVASVDEVDFKKYIDIVDRIVDNLVKNTFRYVFTGKRVSETNEDYFISDGVSRKKKMIPYNKGLPDVSNEELNKIPRNIRPQLTGKMYTTSLNTLPFLVLLDTYFEYLGSSDKESYKKFLKGLDMLDIDLITYEMLNSNKENMGYWLPKIVPIILEQDFFKIAATTIIKVPIPVLQLTRIEQENLTPLTIMILDEYCKRVFSLDPNNKYFIRTGVKSHKYNFARCKVEGSKNISRLGELMLLNNREDCKNTRGLTNEWIVREYIEPVNNKLNIFNGLPLRPEYRVFVDFSYEEKGVRGKVLSVLPYWYPKLMKEIFLKATNQRFIEDKDMYYKSEKYMIDQFKLHRSDIIANLRPLLRDIPLEGQWVIDIMQNGDDFYIVDMGLAIHSNLATFLPKGMINNIKLDWLPNLNNIKRDIINK